MRTIVHLDADAFFASVEQAADARLRGKPIAVGGERRGIIASASYEARKFGVYTPMPTARARKLCPRLIVLPGDYERYEQFSRWMFGYAYDFTPDVEQTSIDEGYFDLTANRRQPPEEIALTIRRAIQQSLKINVSEGLGANKLVSQIASKLHKPAAFEMVPAGQERGFLRLLPNKWLPGVGPKTAVRLNAAGLVEIGQIAGTPVDLLELLLGSQAPILRQFANGIDDRPLIPASEPQVTFSQQETFGADVTDEEYIAAVLRRMADRLFAKVREEGRSIRTLTVKVRYNDRDEDQRSESLREPTDLETDVYGRLRVLLQEAWRRRVSLRMVSLKLSNVYAGIFRVELPLERESQTRAARERLAAVLDDLRRAKGWSVVLRGHDLRLREELCELATPKVSDLRQNRKFEAMNGFKPYSLSDHPSAQVRTDARLGVATSPSPSPQLSPLGRGSSLTQHRASPTRTDWSKSRRGFPLSPRERVGVRGKETFSTPTSEPSPVEVKLAEPPGNAGGLPSRKVGCYTPLRVHSYYSFLDSTLSPEAIVHLAQQHDLPAVALTDLGNLHSAVEFALAARKAGIKPILGVELNVDGHPLLLYVESARGYHNLCRLLSPKAEAARDESASKQNLARSHVDSLNFSHAGRARCPHRAVGRRGEDTPPYLELRRAEGSVAAQQRRAIRRETLEGLSEGLIAVSSDTRLAALFPERFYQLATRRMGPARFPVVACPSVHYATADDRLKFDILQSIRTLTLLGEPHPEKRAGGRLHFRLPEEMAHACREHPDWLAHSWEIADRCCFEPPLGPPQFPPFDPPDHSTPREFLRTLVFDGLRRRYGSRSSTFRPNVEQELEIIHEVGYEGYFLMVWDILQECRRRGIEWITRGSAADSLVCYCLGISDVCPIRFDLYFRRFLNKERMALNKLPDIDIDFPHDRKDDVVDLIFARYGPERCAVVGGFSTFKARSAFAEVAKVLGMAEREVRKFTEHFPWGFGGGWVPDEAAPSGGARLRELLLASPECRDLPLDEEPCKTAIDTAEFLEGFPRYPKMHPCGVVLSHQPMHELTPTFTSNKGYPTTHFDMDAVELVGLVKMDILAQGGLAVMRDTKAALKARGLEVDLEQFTVHDLAKDRVTGHEPPRAGVMRASVLECACPLALWGTPPGSHAFQSGSGLPHSKTWRQNGRFMESPNSPSASGDTEPWTDPAVWDMIASGGARAVHHIESPAMTSLCRMCAVRDIDTLIAIVSVIRPGAANEGKKVAFTRRYQGLEPVTYPHPSLESALRSTYGLVVYEEHILQICEAFAGLPPGRADVLRRALNKQKRAVIEEIREEFFASARARGHADAKIAEVWGLVTGFAGYAFCKAHSTAYGVEAYQAAWLKRYYPAEFMAGVLTNGKGFYEPLVYVLECHRLGLAFLPPSANEPGPAFTARGNALRVPLTRTKGLTQRTRDRLLAERERGPFLSLADFHRRVTPAPEELEAMIRVGAFDEFSPTRTQQFWEAQYLHRSFGGARASGQGWLLPPPSLERFPEVPLREPTRRERLEAETDLLGFTVSQHPLELFDQVAWDTYCPVSQLGEHAGEQVVTCGLVVEQRTHHQITGEPMKFLTLADWTGMVETELFAPTYKSYGLATVRYPVLEVTATVEPFENGRGFSLRVHHAGKPRAR